MNQTDRSVSFSEFIRRRRIALRLKQAEIAVAMRVEPESVGNWESGRRRMELNRIPHLADILKLDANDLCRLALCEWHPCFYDALFGAGMPKQLEASSQDDTSRRNALVTSVAEGSPLERSVIVQSSLGEPKKLAQ